MGDDLEALERLAQAATPQDFDSAEVAQKDGGEIDCPACGGEGYVTLEADYCNYDSKALGVQFYGIGTEHGAAEAYYRAANPATILDLVHRLRTAEAAVAQGQADLLALSAALAEARDNDRAAMSWLVDARAAAGDNGKRMLPEFVVYLKELRADAERYRHLEHLCATGSYGGIISRKAVDASMAAAAPKDERLVLESCGCSESEQETCRGASSPFAEHPRCLRSMQQRKAASEGRPEAGGKWQPIDTAPLDQVVLLASEFDRPGDWRIKCGYFDNDRGCWKVWGASWVPTRWAAIPAPPGSA